MPYHFQYVPPSGPLSGRALEEQTERAINELGGHFDQLSEETSALANQAVNMARTAGSAANEALATANQALSEAQDAQDVAQNAQAASGQALEAALNAQDLSYQCLDSSTTASDMAQSALDAASNATATADTALAASQVAEGRSIEAESLVRSALGYQAGDFSLEETPVDADALIASARIYAAQELRGAPIAAPAYLQIMASSDSASVTQAVWGESAPTPALRNGRITWSATPGESVFEFTAMPESGNAPDDPDNPDNPDYPDEDSGNPESPGAPDGSGNSSLDGRLVIAHDGATLSAAFTPGQFSLEEASDFALSGRLSFELGEDFAGTVACNGQELIRISEGLAVIIDSQAFADNAGLTFTDAAYAEGVLTLDLRAAWLDKSFAVTWGNWTSAAGDAAGLPLGAWLWSPLEKIPFGFLDISKDNGLLSRAAFPQLWETVRDDGNVISESAWQESVAQLGGCGSFSSGDGAATFRLPMIAGLYARAYDPANPDLALGKCLGDAIRNITGSVNPALPRASSLAGDPIWIAGATGVFTTTELFASKYYTATGTISSGGNESRLNLDVSLQVPTADENRPKTVCQTPIMKVYGVATDAGEANIAQLIAATTGKLDSAVYEHNSQYYREDFTSSGTFIPKKLGMHRVRICGGGGGGGGVKFGDATGGAGGGGGGSSGQEGDVYINITSLASIPITIGAGGAGGVATTGGTGGNTSFGSYATVAGGYGGAGNTNTSTTGYTFYNGGGARATGCNPGGHASICQMSFAAGKIIYVNPGQGGQSTFGIAGCLGRTSVTGNGVDGRGYGAGGSGAVSFNGESATGGNGAPGYIRIEYTGLHG